MLIGRLRRAAQIVAAILFAAMFGAFILQIFTRYVLNNPTAWTQEATLICYIWVIFWCAAFLLKEEDHITFDMLAHLAPKPARRVMALVSATLIALAFAVSLPKVADWISFMKIERTPVIGLRYDYLYSIFLIFCIAVIVRSALRVWKLLSPRWETVIDQPQIAPPE